MIIWVVVLLVIIAGGWYVATNWGAGIAFGGGPSVAMVNGEKISKADFEATRAQVAAGQGVDITALGEEEKSQFENGVLENMISQRLLLQVAAKKGIATTNEQVDTQLATLAEQFGGAEAMQTALAEQGFTDEALRAQVKSDLTIQAYLQLQFPLESFVISEEEVAEVYAQFAVGTEDAPALDEVRGEIESFVRQQKQQQAVTAHVAELRAAGEVEVLI